MKVIVYADNSVATVAEGYDIYEFAKQTGGKVVDRSEYSESAKEVEDASASLRKIARDKAVSQIVVSTSSGLVFDGDEVSQGRMARAIIGIQGRGSDSTIQWVLHDNTVADVSVAELQEALALSGLRQTELWVSKDAG